MEPLCVEHPCLYCAQSCAMCLQHACMCRQCAVQGKADCVHLRARHPQASLRPDVDTMYCNTYCIQSESWVVNTHSGAEA